MADTDTAGKVSPADYGTGDAGKAARWHAEIKLALKGSERWLKDCRKVEDRYRDERRNSDTDSARFNVLWSNIETLKPAVYARPPVPVVTRRFRDSDPVARAAALILQRNLQHAIEEGDLHHRIKMARDDYLLFARGTLWARYEPHMQGTTDEVAIEGPQVDGDSENERLEVVYEEVEWDFVHRDDFLHGAARIWAEVPWVGRRVRMTREEGVERFGDKFKDVPLNWKPNHITDAEVEENQAFLRAVVYEIWNIDDRRVYWIADGYDDLLDEKKDPLGLAAFWPCPRPLYGTLTNESLMPIPDYMEYQDQALELDRLTGRIDKITEAVKVVGVYDNRFDALGRVFEEGTDNELFPVDNYAELQAKGGLDGAFDLIDTSSIASVLETLFNVRTSAKNDLYEITGIADIIRGSTAPEETATAQRIKGRYATLRLSDRQLEMARFVRDLLRITAEIICRHFAPQTMLLASNFRESEVVEDETAMPEGMLTAQAIALLKDDRLRTFRVDVEDKSTIAMDDEEEKQGRTEFLTAVGAFLKEAVAIPPQLAPILVPVLGKMLLFGVRGFRAGVEMETALEDAVQKLTQQTQAMAKQPPPPDPDMIKAQTEQAKVQADIAMQQQQMQHDAQVKAAELQVKQQEMAVAAEQAKVQNAQDYTQHQIAIDKAQLERERFAHEAQQAEREHQLELMKVALEARKLDLEEQKLHVSAAQGARDSDIKEKSLEKADSDA